MKQPFLLIHSPVGIEEAKARLARSRKPAARVMVGIWSLDAWLSGVAELIGKLNRAQRTFVFYEVDALVPAGLISRPERMLPWIAGLLGERSVTGRIKRDIQDNLIANDFFGLADAIRDDFGLDYLVGITPSMVAEEEDENVYWNYFSTSNERTILASSYDLREFAQSTGLPFEAFLANLIVSQLLATASPELGYHPNTGCLFDEDLERVTLIDKVRVPKIDPGCMKNIEPKYRDAAAAFLELLRSMRNVNP